MIFRNRAAPRCSRLPEGAAAAPPGGARPRHRTSRGGAGQPSWARRAASGRGRRQRPPCGSPSVPPSAARRAPPERRAARRPQHRRYRPAWQGGSRPAWWTAARGETRPLTARGRPGRGRAGSAADAAADGGGGRAAGPGSRARAASGPVPGGMGRAEPGWAGPGGASSRLPFPSPPFALRPAGAVSRRGPARCSRSAQGRSGPPPWVPGRGAGPCSAAGAGERGHSSSGCPEPRGCPGPGESPLCPTPSGGIVCIYLFFFNVRIMSFILCYFSLWKKKNPSPSIEQAQRNFLSFVKASSCFRAFIPYKAVFSVKPEPNPLWKRFFSFSSCRAVGRTRCQRSMAPGAVRDEAQGMRGSLVAAAPAVPVGSRAGRAPRGRSGSANRAGTCGLQGRRKEETSPSGFGFSLQGKAPLRFQGSVGAADGVLLLSLVFFFCFRFASHPSC